MIKFARQHFPTWFWGPKVERAIGRAERQMIEGPELENYRWSQREKLRKQYAARQAIWQMARDIRAGRQ